MMTGPIIDSAAIIAGGLGGAFLKKVIPRRLEKGLTPMMALIAFAIGITMIIKVKFFPVVALAVIIGSAIGELLYLEQGVQKAAGQIRRLVERIFTHDTDISHEEYGSRYASIIVLFCVSGLGILGSLTEGLTGDYQLLLIKAILDFFTAIVFAMSLGVPVAVVALPQFAVQAALYMLARLIMPYMDELAYADFSACGGLIMLAIGFRLAKIREFSVINMLPSLILVIPLSYLWRQFFG